MDLSKTKLADLGTMSGINSSAGSDVALPAGKVIADRFEIIGVIGQGGMGTVYEAYDQMREDQVALKFLRPEFVSSDNARQRFLNEAKIAISLSHPNIISVYDVVKYENTCFLTMELLKGQSLRQRLHDLAQASEVMPVNEAMSIAKDVCEALANAHKSTIHRDIKPENIWLLPDGRAKLMDFGIARLQDQTSGLTKTSAVLGTAYYMAPEQLVGTGQIDHRADQYSLGVVLFEMLTGTLPIGRHAAVSAMRKGINKKIDPVIETMLSGKMGERYPDDKALLEALNKVPVSETGGGLPKGAGKAVAAAVLLIAVAGAGYGGWQWMEQKAKNEVIRLAEEQAKAEALAKAEVVRQTEEQAKAEALAKAKQAEAAQKGYVSQSGLTWMPVTFQKNWAEANRYCATTPIRGQSGWRLPTKDELSALYASGAIKGQGWTLSFTWSSTPNSTGFHYVVSLDNGFVSGSYDTYNGVYVTCAR